MQVLGGSPHGWNAKRIPLIGRVAFAVATPNKEITLLPMLVGRREVGNNRSSIDPLRNIQKAFRGFFHAEKVQQQSYARNLEALISENNQKADQNTPEIGRKMSWAHIECKTLLMKGCKGKRRLFSKAALKK